MFANIVNEVVIGLGFGALRFSFRLLWPTLRAWLRDFSLVDSE